MNNRPIPPEIELSDAGLEAGEDAFDVVLRVGLPKELGLLARKLISSPCGARQDPSSNRRCA
jgi:hypothetical protein